MEGVQAFFEEIWKSCATDDFLKLHIPDTIVFEKGLPLTWYFTSWKTGKVLRKKYESLTTSKIEELFIKKSRGTHFIAQFIIFAEPAEETNHVEYPPVLLLTRQGLADFLCASEDQKHSHTGLLQNISVDRQMRVESVEALWLENIFRVEKHVETCSQGAHDHGSLCLTQPQKQAGILLLNKSYSNSFAIYRGALLDEIKSICNKIVRHLCRVRETEIRSLCLMFSLQTDGVLSLIYPLQRQCHHRTPGEEQLEAKQDLVNPDSAITINQRLRPVSRQALPQRPASDEEGLYCNEHREQRKAWTEAKHHGIVRHTEDELSSIVSSDCNGCYLRLLDLVRKRFQKVPMIDYALPSAAREQPYVVPPRLDWKPIKAVKPDRDQEKTQKRQRKKTKPMEATFKALLPRRSNIDVSEYYNKHSSRESQSKQALQQPNTRLVLLQREAKFWSRLKENLC